MNTITKQVVLLALCLTVSLVSAQKKEIDSLNTEKEMTSGIQYKLERLEELKKTIENEEREFLKREVEAINEQLEKGLITQEEADKRKKEAAEKRALNIENRLAIIDN
ncbi:MAG: hypothetical protein HRU26_07640, partial [Psychroserpens sp.]|nr:hypothetical protein [Psychroserpens sp.]